MTELTQTIYAVEVPEDASRITILPCGHLRYFNGNRWVDIKVKLNTYTILGTVTNGVVDFDCEGLVDEVGAFVDYGYDANYLSHSFFIDPTQSFRSLLQSKYLDASGNFDPNAVLDQQYLAPAIAQLFQLTEKDNGPC